VTWVFNKQETAMYKTNERKGINQPQIIAHLDNIGMLDMDNKNETRITGK